MKDGLATSTYFTNVSVSAMGFLLSGSMEGAMSEINVPRQKKNK